MMTLNLLDMIILGLTGVSAIIGLFRGMTKEALTMLTWAIAFIVAFKYGLVVGNMLGGISTDLVRSIIGGFLLFIGILIIGGIINIILNKFIKISGFIVIDKVLGAGFGILRSLVVLLIVVPMVANLCAEKPWWQGSILIPKLQQLATQVQANLPDDWRQSYGEFVDKFGLK